MQQLDEIVDLAASDDVRLATILRKCLVVAARLKNDRLKEWATAELNGYPDHLAMPEYRVTGITARGFFIGSYGAQINDQPLASGLLDEDHRWWATTAYLKEGISSYEAMVGPGEKQGSATMPWPADMVAHYQSKFIQGYVLNRAWQEIPIGAIVAVVDTVRTRLLQFALEMQGEIGADDAAVPPAANVDRAVQTIIYGGMNILGAVAGDVQLVGQQVVIQGDFQTLATALKTAGIEDKRVAELERAIDADREAGAEKGFGSHVAGWLQKAGSYVGKEGLKAGLGVAQAAATKAVLAYFGLAA